MKRRPVKKKQDKGAAKWLVTYSDMVTLILVFFILLFSMSTVDQIKLEAVAQSFQERVIFDFMPSIVPNDQPENTEAAETAEDDHSDDPIDLDRALDEYESKAQEDESLNHLIDSVEDYLDEHDLNDIVSATRTERGVLLVIQESIFFDTGEAIILEEGKPFLEELATLFSQLPNDIKVEGHSDSRPINTYRYPSNWELSGARASSVVRYFIEEFNLDESRFSIAGYADTRQIAPNDTEENMSMNRRVEITILNTDAQEEN